MTKEFTEIEDKARNVRGTRTKWANAWSDWELITFIDHVIAKLRRAWYVAELNPDLEDCLIDAFNYSQELKRRLKEANK